MEEVPWPALCDKCLFPMWPCESTPVAEHACKCKEPGSPRHYNAVNGYFDYIDCRSTVQENQRQMPQADADQSALCAYLSLIALAGLAINAIWHVKWADPIAALAVLPLIVCEGREGMRGKACGCC